MSDKKPREAEGEGAFKDESAFKDEGVFMSIRSSADLQRMLRIPQGLAIASDHPQPATLKKINN